MTVAASRRDLAHTDPRPDRIGDAALWERLLPAAFATDPSKDGVCGALRGARIIGCRLERGASTLVLRPPLDMAQDEWTAWRARWLVPHRDALTELLRAAQVTGTA
jgi:hypothetical protein